MTSPSSQSSVNEVLLPGDLLHGTYRILELLARGGMGDVHLASHERLPGRFALKVPHAHRWGDAGTLSRFQTEAQLLATLRHPNIVQIHDFNVTAWGMPYLVMELVEGANLRQRLRDEGRFTAARVAELVDQLARALQTAHEHGFAHLDLKLENVMLTSCEGHPQLVKLLDFGIARPIAATGGTFDDMLAGTPQFMAPEQIGGAPEDIDDRADQFALACIAYALLVGWEPFRGDAPLAVLYQVLHDDPRPLTEALGPSFDLASRVVLRALAKDPVRRFATVTEFAATLRRALEAVESEAPLVRRAA